MKQRILGLMSGTALDGIDMALLDTDGEAQIDFIADAGCDYPPDIRDRVRAALDEAQKKGGKPDNTDTIEALVTDAYIAAIQDFCAAHEKPDVIGLHGQTIYHNPREGISIQLGDAARIASTCGIDVVADFRTADILAGGEGAPLAPLFHAALIDRIPTPTLPIIVVNIGGVANLTYYDGETILAFDTGTGNALIDDWIAQHTPYLYDKDGATAAQGKADMQCVAEWLRDTYFQRPYPKSLDRLNFTHNLNTSLEDGAATLTAFTAEAIALGIKQLPHPPKKIILCGGGRHNLTLLKMLEASINHKPILCEDVGWNGDALEAQAFAWLAMRSIRGLPLSLPQTTGVPAPQTGGRLFSGSA